MATIQSTKPGDIAGSSVLTGRTPSYRLVLKVDPQTGQYKYEYEVDDNPKAVDAVTAPPPPASGTGGDSGASIPKGEEGSDKDAKKDPATSFEQTRAALAGREPSGRGPLDQRESNFKPDDRNFGQMALDSESARSRNLALGAINPVFGLLGTAKTMDDRRKLKELGISTPVAREQIADVYGKAIADGKTPQEALREATLSGGVALTDQAFEDAGVPELSINKQLEDFKAGRRTGPSVDDSALGKSTFDQTVDALGGVTDTRRPDALDMGTATNATKSVIGSTIDNQIRELENKLVGKTGKTKTRLTQELNSLKDQKAELEKPTKVFTGTPKQQQQKKGPFDLVTRESVTPTKKPDQPKTTGRPNMRDIAGDQLSRVNANYGAAKTGKEKRGVENSTEVKGIRDRVGQQTADPGRTVDRDNAVSSKARANELSDKNGNAITSKKTGKAINVKAPRYKGLTQKKGAMLTRDEVKQRKAEIDAQKAAKGDKGGKKGRIICSELYRQGLISKEDYVLDLYYTSKHLTSQHTAGYWHFAVPAVKAMRRSKFWTAFWKEIAYNRLQDIKWRLGEGKFNLRGRIYSFIFEPVCYIGGYFKSNATYKELYEGDKQWQ